MPVGLIPSVLQSAGEALVVLEAAGVVEVEVWVV
jgi:hypothetical protein